MQNRDFPGTEPIGRLLLKLAVPTVIAQLVNMLYNVAANTLPLNSRNMGDIRETD